MLRKACSLLAIYLLSCSQSLDAAQLSLRYAGSPVAGEHDWYVLVHPSSVSSIAVEIGLQFTGGSITAIAPNAAIFDDLNPGQNPFAGAVTIGTSIHNGGSSAFIALGGVIPEVRETLVMTVVTDGIGTLMLGGQNHNGYFIGARVWQGASPTDGLWASLLVAGTEADFNLDGRVDGADFLQWQRGLGITSGALRANGDANADGAVNGVDLTIWRGQFGATSPSAVIAVPEPNVTSCALFAGIALVIRTKRARLLD
jgi:hypothetical protein